LKTAIVTGASGGIGGGIVRRLCKDGYFVFAHYNGNESAVDNLMAEFPNSVYKIKFDVKDEESVKSGIKKIASIKNRIDLLVNCAGVDLYKLSNQTTKIEWENLFSVNVTGTHLVTSSVLDNFISQKSGKIVNISSIWGVVGASMEVCYSASKSAIIGYTKALAKEVIDKGVYVNCVSPGTVSPEMDSASPNELSYLGRQGTSNENAGLICFLASDDASYIVGQNIQIDGGRKKI
jgi:3-oxoacyl-[acyl-carrier protein] reductase